MSSELIEEEPDESCILVFPRLRCLASAKIGDAKVCEPNSAG